MTTTGPRDSVAGAVGLPIAIVAVVLALIPPITFYIAWVPGAIGLAVGIIGIVRSRPSASKQLAKAAVIVSGASFLISAGWFAIGWFIVNVLAECLAPTCL